MERLPVELFDIIYGYLVEDSEKATFTLRLVSRHFERLLFDRFNKQYFTTRSYDLSSRNLQAMMSVSQHVSFGSTVRKLTLTANPFLDSISNPRHFEDIDIEDPWVMEDGDSDLAVIMAALSNFKNVERIRVCGPDEKLKGFETYHTKLCSVMHATTQLLQSIATIQPRLSHFKVDSGGMFAKNYGLDLWALDIPKPIYVGLRGALNDLRSLSLDLWNEEYLHHWRPEWSADKDATVVYDFLSASPNLSSLKLYWRGHCQNWANRLEICTRIARMYRSPNLAKLILGGFQLEVQDWINLLANHEATLKHLEILMPKVTGGVSPLFQVVRDTLSLKYLILVDVIQTNPPSQDENQVVFPDDLVIANRRTEVLEDDYIWQDEFLEVTGSEEIKRAMTRTIDAHYLVSLAI